MLFVFKLYNYFYYYQFVSLYMFIAEKSSFKVDGMLAPLLLFS